MDLLDRRRQRGIDREVVERAANQRTGPVGNGRRVKPSERFQSLFSAGGREAERDGDAGVGLREPEARPRPVDAADLGPFADPDADAWSVVIADDDRGAIERGGQIGRAGVGEVMVDRLDRDRPVPGRRAGPALDGHVAAHVVAGPGQPLQQEVDRCVRPARAGIPAPYPRDPLLGTHPEQTIAGPDGRRRPIRRRRQSHGQHRACLI